ncbi:MAG: LemA family protein [Sphingobacteriaceae bacterium]
MIAILIIAGLAVLIIFWLISIYNRLVGLRNRRENAFADVDVQLKQRLDLIPQLVSTVKGYAAHEKGVLEQVTKARAGVMAAQSVEGKVQAENMLTSALQGLRIAIEAYPDLKANQNFMQLQEEIADIENKLAASRRFFNSATQELNTAIERFPNTLISSRYGFARQTLFTVGDENRAAMEQAPVISF